MGKGASVSLRLVKGAVIRDAKLGEQLAINDRPAQFVLLMKVERVMGHCPKAFIRGKVWEPEGWPDTSDVPSLSQMMKAHGELNETLSEVENVVTCDRKYNLY